MNLSVGIVGLPNVGKSTLFNALLKKQQALAANYPFATIEPNVGIVAVPDPRLAILAKITNDEEREELKDLFVLANKQQIVVLNVSESQYNPEGIKKATEGYAHIIASESSRHAELDSASQQKIPDQVRDDDGNVVVICAQIE